MVLVALADLLATPKQARTGCKVSIVLAELGNEDAAVLRRALENPLFTAREIVAALRAEGHPVGRTTVQEHRSGSCTC